MSEFEFLLEDEQKPDHIIEIDNTKEIERYIAEAVKGKAKAEVMIPHNNGSISASSELIKIIKINDNLYINFDTLVPERAHNILYKQKTGIITILLDSLEMFAFKIEKLATHSSITGMLVKVPESIYRMYKRRYYRVPVGDSKSSFVSLTINDSPLQFPLHVISAGGLAFYSAQPLESYFPFDNSSGNYSAVVSLEGTIMHVQLIVRNGSRSRHRKYKYVIGCEFHAIVDENREFIARYVVKKQLEDIKKSKKYF